MKSPLSNICLLQTGGFKNSRLSSIQSSRLNGIVKLVARLRRRGPGGPRRGRALCRKLATARRLSAFRVAVPAQHRARALDLDRALTFIEPHGREAASPNAAAVERRIVRPPHEPERRPMTEEDMHVARAPIVDVEQR